MMPNIKITRGFAKCPMAGCRERATIYVGIQGQGRDAMLCLLDADMEHAYPAGWRGFKRQEELFRVNGVYCEAHRVGMTIKPLKARLNPKSSCTDKCLTAIGPDCECECAGKNHGKRSGARLG